MLLRQKIVTTIGCAKYLLVAISPCDFLSLLQLLGVSNIFFDISHSQALQRCILGQQCHMQSFFEFGLHLGVFHDPNFWV